MEPMLPPIRDVIRDRRLRGGSAIRVYLALRYDPQFRLAREAWKPVDQEALRVLLKVSLSTVERAIAVLIQEGYLASGTRVPGSPQHYKLVCPQRKVA